MIYIYPKILIIVLLLVC